MRSCALYEGKAFPLPGALGMADTCQGSGDVLRNLPQEIETSNFSTYGMEEHCVERVWFTEQVTG